MILAILQARVSSSRLPGKVLKPILGKPMLQHQLERLQRARKFDKLVVATSDQPDDQDLVALCRNAGVGCFRGSLNDVLDRFYQTAKPLVPQHVVRLTGDCPLTDPELVDRVIQFHLDGVYDYTSNTIEPTYPDGLDATIMRFSSLETAWREATLPSDREHVAPFIWKQPDRFKIGSVKGSDDLSHLRWTVDEPEDFELVTQVYEALYAENPRFGTDDILKLLAEKPYLAKLNSAFTRNEGYLKSLEKDQYGVRG